MPSVCVCVCVHVFVYLVLFVCVIYDKIGVGFILLLFVCFVWGLFFGGGTYIPGKKSSEET